MNDFDSAARDLQNAEGIARKHGGLIIKDTDWEDRLLLEYAPRTKAGFKYWLPNASTLGPKKGTRQEALAFLRLCEQA